jgi:hypothetical protein
MQGHHHKTLEIVAFGLQRAVPRGDPQNQMMKASQISDQLQAEGFGRRRHGGPPGEMMGLGSS